MNKPLYLAMVIIRKQKVQLLGNIIPEPLNLTWADGMVGCMPVFESLEELKAAYPDAEAMEITMK